MEHDRKYKGLKRYAPLLHTICKTDNYYELSEQEWEGCIGVACVISVIEGVPSTIFALSKHLDIPYYDVNLKHAFERLRINGIFTITYNITKDPFLTGRGIDREWAKGPDLERNAWCNMAGIAGGFIGIKEETTKKEKNHD